MTPQQRASLLRIAPKIPTYCKDCGKLETMKVPECILCVSEACVLKWIDGKPYRIIKGC